MIESWVDEPVNEWTSFLSVKSLHHLTPTFYKFKYIFILEEI